MAEAQFLAQVEALLATVTSAQDTQVLKQATKELPTYYKSDLCMPALVHILQQSQNTAVRQLAAVEARKLSPKMWNDTFAPQIRSTILDSTLAEQDPKTRHASARLISAIAKMDMKDGKWPELTYFCQHASTSQRASDREVGLFVIFSLLESEPDFFENKMGDLMQLFSHTIQDPESRDVRQTTLLSLGEISARIYDDDKALIKGFREVLPHMTVVLNQAIEADHESDARNAFEVFENLLIVESSLVSKNLSDLLHFFVGICTNREVDPTYRHMALSFMATAIRFKRQRIQSLKLGPDLLLAMLHIAMEPEEDDLDEDSPVRLAIVNIDILATSLPPTHVVPPLLEQFPRLAQSSNPHERRAAMSALGAVMEGTMEFMTSHIENVLPFVLERLRDSDSLVVRAALIALSRITEELPSEVDSHHSTMVPIVFDLLGSHDSSVMKAACNTLDAILEWVPKDAVTQYLPKLMEALLYILTTSSDTDVKVIVSAAIGTAAHASKEGFYPYLGSSMHTFFSMKEVTGDDDFDLRGTVTDTLGTIASAVGKDKFLPYMEKSFQLAFEGIKIDSSRLRESAFCFFAVMASVLKDGLTPVLPQIMPPIIEVLNQEDLDFGDKVTEDEAKALLNGEVDIADSDDDDDDDESINLNVNSALQLEKEIAADALGEIFVNVREAFLPYLQTATEQLLELADTFYEGSRKSALSSLWKFVTTLGEIQVTEAWQPGLPVKIPLPADVDKLTEVVRKKSMEVLKDENDRDVIAEVFRSISDAMNLLGPGILGSDGNELAAITLLVLSREHPSQVEDDDEEPPSTEDDDIAEVEGLLIEAAVDVVIAMAKVLREQFAPEFGPFYRRLVKSTKSKNSTERAMAVAGLGEIAGALRGSVSKHTGEMLNVFMNSINDSSVEVSSNSIYALGLLLEGTPQDLSSQYNAVLNKLQRFFSDDAPINAKENAIGCVSRMILRHPQIIPLDLVLPAIVRSLPLKDYAENEPTYTMIIQLYHAHNHIMLSLTDQLIVPLAKVLTAEDQQVKSATKISLLELVKVLRAEYPQLFQAHSGLGMPS